MLEYANMYHTNEYQQAEDRLREVGKQLSNAQEELEEAENTLRKTSKLRIELAEAESKRSSLVEQSKNK